MPHTLEELRLRATERLKFVRSVRERGGIAFNGYRFHTDTDSQVKLTGITLAALQDPAYSVQFKTMDGVFAYLDRAAVLELATAVRAHIQACYDFDARAQQEIDEADTEGALRCAVGPAGLKLYAYV
jgi:hypothetical protein